ncbi:hypothetical protein ACJX0J_007440, partial [Zea mays]
RSHAMAGDALIVIVTSFLLALPSATAIGKVCGNAGNYTANGRYRSNLDSLAAALPANTSSSPQLFANATAGQAPDAVYALALCRGDLTGNLTGCSACVNGSLQYARRACPYAKAASVYDDNCLIGYSSANILVPAYNATRDTSTLFDYWNSMTIAGNGTLVAAHVDDLLTQTAQQAASSPRRFVTAYMDGSSNAVIPTLYSLAQCTPDLSAGDCLACLQRILGLLNATTSMTQIRPSSGAPAPPPPSPTTNKGSGVKPWVIAVSVAPPVAVVAFCFILYNRRQRRRFRRGRSKLRQKHPRNNLKGDELDWEMETELSEFSVFDFHQILEATDNFSEENKLGEGGFGPVYKGQFPDGTEIAVKRLASHSGQGFVEFKNEVQLIAKLQHTNLVRLLGCCSQGEEKILVYEYLPNKSLDFFIFDENRKSLLDWKKRLAIIEGIAEGLLYLHKHSRLRVIHRDLKPSNILLDSEMNPKISDFGLAKIFSSNNIEGSTTRRVVGTYGYMAPEYASEGIFSIKSDVFSFGVLILEILSGKRNSGNHDYGDFINILGY